MTRYVSAVPAYGRDYQDEADVRRDWAEGKDFLVQDLMIQGFVNKDDLPPDTVLHIRYNKLRDICMIDQDSPADRDPEGEYDFLPKGQSMSDWLDLPEHRLPVWGDDD